MHDLNRLGAKSHKIFEFSDRRQNYGQMERSPFIKPNLESDPRTVNGTARRTQELGRRSGSCKQTRRLFLFLLASSLVSSPPTVISATADLAKRGLGFGFGFADLPRGRPELLGRDPSLPIGSLPSQDGCVHIPACARIRQAVVRWRQLWFREENRQMMEPAHLPLNPQSGSSPKKSSESALILIRHGESLWNEKNLFTGCVDVPLTPKGVDEAIEAGKRICNIPVDVIYTSSLIRAQMTAMLAMMQHRCKKVPIIVHNESEQAHRWSQIYSEETKKQSIPVKTAWQLNERMYGELQGLNKQETADRFGKEQVHEWRRSYNIPPPNGESLEMCAERAVAYFKDQIVPQLVAGKHVMIAAHGNSLRSIIMHLDKLTSQEVIYVFSGITFHNSSTFIELGVKTLLPQVISLELSTGIPMLYVFKEGEFIRRGSPAGPSEAGVYAYTRSLAQYRQKLDNMFQ
ncbi:hypothetical protein GUJ93_ZPchr0006g44834 [Zizania palustris]|uniref:Phosphoglycerate mutase (2,3-diphosphoglycerate-dependent) n=1 Tax=Zizania palustris TaxID=103762 RepID=A0A8J5VMJ8_ZIZPA|nr:hypothetical protein GUJ93_ZPchr0006g44834 [Zizania palustris]KAG8072420.1 hypothetical protein GUJ93_ZPchr0006g44834 [Zizania palustris]